MIKTHVVQKTHATLRISLLFLSLGCLSAALFIRHCAYASGIPACFRILEAKAHDLLAITEEQFFKAPKRLQLANTTWRYSALTSRGHVLTVDGGSRARSISRMPPFGKVQTGFARSSYAVHDAGWLDIWNNCSMIKEVHFGTLTSNRTTGKRTLWKQYAVLR